MLPWGHVAVGYLLYSGYRRGRYGVSPRAVPAIAVMIGTQFPDIVDKPLAWTFGVLTHGRSFAHSLLTAAIVLAVLWQIAKAYDHEATVAAFGLGYVSHSIVDVLFYYPDLQLENVRFLVWPLLALPDPVRDYQLLRYLLSLTLTPKMSFQIALFGLAAIVWWLDGRPGLELAWTQITRPFTRPSEP